MLNEWIDEVTYVLGRIGYDAATFRYPADRKRGPFHTLALRGGDVAWYAEAGRWYGDYAKGDRPALGMAWSRRKPGRSPGTNRPASMPVGMTSVGVVMP